MKLTILFLLAFTITAHAQTGVKAGPNISYFAQGDATYRGVSLATVGFAGSVYHTITKGNWSLTPAIEYIHMGAKNPNEWYNSETDATQFSTYYVGMPVVVGYRVGSVTLNAGGYVSRLVAAANREFYGGGFSWKVKDWDYYQKVDVGLISGVLVDLGSVGIALDYRRGLVDVRGESYGDVNLVGSVNAAWTASIVVPFKIFGK